MRTVILAGGVGSRLSEETILKPKPMIEIGTHPIIWHIMKHYAHHGFSDFAIALGYKGEVIKRYFTEYAALAGDMTVRMAAGTVERREADREDWTVHLAFHRSHGRLATITTVRPPARFGHVELDGDCVAEFSEKPQTDEGWINGGYMVLEAAVLDYIESDDTYFQKEPMERLAADRQLMAYRHESFWQCMDTLRDKVYLETLWETGGAPWRVWS